MLCGMISLGEDDKNQVRVVPPAQITWICTPHSVTLAAGDLRQIGGSLAHF